MRIMDGTTKTRMAPEANMGDQKSTLENLNVKRRKLEANEADLRKYEEQVFVDTIVESKTFRNKRELHKDFKTIRLKQ